HVEDLSKDGGERESEKPPRFARARHTRLRPVLMTALAMIVGMLPMALGLGEGGEQNAPLGRAVIGGLIVATITTLFFVPMIYSLLRKKEFTCDEDEQFARQEHGDTAEGVAQ